MIEGIVKWFDDVRGFGFIRSSGFRDDIMVHYSVIRDRGHRTLAPNEVVLFEIDTEHSDRGHRARVVERTHKRSDGKKVDDLSKRPRFKSL